MVCKICNNFSEKIFEKVILQKYNSGYYKCTICAFVQTDEPIWLAEAYESAITSLDIGLLSRNTYLKDEISLLIDTCFPDAKKMIDYAGGYGVFVRIMRDAGYEFYREDKFCENIFAKHFDVNDIPKQKFDIVTGFEVLEHFNNPLIEIENIFKYSDVAVFSTVITPKTNKEIEDWWYIVEETGQHISFYSDQSMKFIAEKFQKNYYCKNGNIHIFSTNKIDKSKFKAYFSGKNKKSLRTFVSNIFKAKKKVRNSLQQNDYQFIKNMLNSKS